MTFDQTHFKVGKRVQIRADDSRIENSRLQEKRKKKKIGKNFERQTSSQNCGARD